MNRSIWASSDNNEALATSTGDGCFAADALFANELFFPVADCEEFIEGVTPAGGKPSLARWSSIIRSLMVVLLFLVLLSATFEDISAYFVMIYVYIQYSFDKEEDAKIALE